MKRTVNVNAKQMQKSAQGGPGAYLEPIGLSVKKPMPSVPTIPCSIVLGLLVSASLGGCGPSAPPTVRQQTPPPTEETRRTDAGSSSQSLNATGSQKQRQAEFLNRLRAADPQSKTIDRAVLNGQNELGLILDRSVSMDSIPALMRTMLAQMAKEFPGQDLEVVAYAPSNPPMKIGTAHLNARTRDMTYTKEHP